ncbi:acetyl-CoA C-acyltransferase [Campylobacter sp. MIT 99-7217]|uniref:acetyl-CoA C-acetyltransferase n=1 Tax=Campylobacter sp. MIT 99-7217 TaxID=535091 RepID=UPI001158FF8C|nr:acetyl-CoA C-acetyltransferase [Campylobacter sp. MIT 99-7217]TQR31912.1 acetyl-CoA C-acyltransferase [Campylobacter sp. MIT 99-7217]
MQEVVIVSAKRTAIGSFMGSLKNTKAVDLATIVAKQVLKDINLDPNQVDELILGQILQAGCGQNSARQVLLASGIDESKGAFTVNKLCGSGLKAIALAYQSIALGDQEIVLAGGTENMSLAPFLLENVRDGYKMGDKKVVDSMIKDALTCAMNTYHMGVTAENLAKKYNISREEQDEFALQSQLKAKSAIDKGKFKDEIVPVVLKSKKGESIFEVDEFVRGDITKEGLSKLKPAFDKEGSVTAGNASGINDGAAMLVIMSKKKAKELGLEILATIKATASVGVDPSIMGIGAAMAAKKVLEKANMKITDIDLIEANEAFASQSLASIKELKPELHKLNVNGGAIALGHPVGASGARIMVTLLHEMKKQKKQFGLATLCVGGGQGIACIVERGE